MQRYRNAYGGHRRPFWLPASNYYILAAAISAAFFFLLWGILHDGGEETPFVPAGIGASVLLGLAVVVREIFLRRARNRFLASQRMERTLRSVPARVASENAPKLTLERNAAILSEIARKSEAAKVLGKFAEAHKEVFDLCEEYIAATARELPTIAVGSPRIAALRRGSEVASRYHHFHLLQWAEIQARALTQEARKHVKISRRIETAEEALSVVGFALKHYPSEASLLESEKVLQELLASIKVSHLMEKAERAAFKGNNKRAISLYQDALFELERQRSTGSDAAPAFERIKQEVSRLMLLEERADAPGRSPEF